MFLLLNYTGRQTLNGQHVSHLDITKSRGVVSFDLELDLSAFNLPDHATVYIEFFRRFASRTFCLGSPAAIQIPAERSINEFRDVDMVYYTIRVTDNTDNRILALGERFQKHIRDLDEDETSQQPETDTSDEQQNAEPQGEQSLLPISPEALGDIIWLLELENDMPVLRVNSDIPDVKTFFLDRSVQALVYPEVLRNILWKIMIGEEQVTHKDQWLKLGLKCTDETRWASEDRTDLENWINSAVAGFCRLHNFKKAFMDTMENQRG